MLSVIKLFKMIKMISNIIENDIRKTDLNLLIVLLVLYRERSVTKAADSLHLGQPAISGALKRLREFFNDPLFVRQSNGMIPTPRADTLVQNLTPLVESLHSHLFELPVFSPKTSRKTFRIGMSEWLEQWITPTLFSQIYQQAPGVSLKVVNVDPFQAQRASEEGIVDVVISLNTASNMQIESEVIRHMGYRTVWSGKQISFKPPIKLNEFLDKEHLLVSYTDATHSPLDKELERQGKSRNIRYISTHFSSYPLILNQQPLLATIPHGLALIWNQYYDLRVSEVPVEYEGFKICLLWHKKNSNDPSFNWLLGHLRKAIMN